MRPGSILVRIREWVSLIFIIYDLLSQTNWPTGTAVRAPGAEVTNRTTPNREYGWAVPNGSLGLCGCAAPPTPLKHCCAQIKYITPVAPSRLYALYAIVPGLRPSPVYGLRPPPKCTLFMYILDGPDRPDTKPITLVNH
jgi:hypothetical protein